MAGQLLHRGTITAANVLLFLVSMAVWTGQLGSFCSAPVRPSPHTDCIVCRPCDSAPPPLTVASSSTARRAAAAEPSNQLTIAVPLDDDLFIVQTKTEPPFYISPWHPKKDRMRCGIVNDGQYYDTDLTRVLSLALGGQDPSLVLDVGANIGWATLYPAAMGHHVISIEAMPQTALRLTTGIRANGFDKLVTLHQVAIGDPGQDNNATVEMIEPAFGPGTTKIMQKSDEGFTFLKHITVPVKRATSLLPPSQKLRLAKIDIEGFEGVVLEDLLSNLNYRVPYIYVEVWPKRWPETGVDTKQMLTRLFEADYKLFVMAEGSGYRVLPPPTEYTDVDKLMEKLAVGGVVLRDHKVGKGMEHLHHDILAVQKGFTEPDFSVPVPLTRACG